MKPFLETISTTMAVVFSLANINLILTTVILLLTVGYWTQKNIIAYKERRKLNKEDLIKSK